MVRNCLGLEKSRVEMPGVRTAWGWNCLGLELSGLKLSEVGIVQEKTVWGELLRGGEIFV